MTKKFKIGDEVFVLDTVLSRGNDAEQCSGLTGVVRATRHDGCSVSMVIPNYAGGARLSWFIFNDDLEFAYQKNKHAKKFLKSRGCSL
jgi:hypothetical protein